MRAWDNPGIAYLVEIAIEGESQGKGHRYHLMLQSLLHLKNDGISTIVLTVDPDNSRARHIYCNKFGFEFVEYRKNEYGQGRDRLFLRLDLEKWTR